MFAVLSRRVKTAAFCFVSALLLYSSLGITYAHAEELDSNKEQSTPNFSLPAYSAETQVSAGIIETQDDSDNGEVEQTESDERTNAGSSAETEVDAVEAPSHSAAGTWSKTTAGWSYITSSGALKGFQQIDGTTYYFDETTGLMKTGWLLHDGTWYHFARSGALHTGWIKLKGTWYYLDPANNGKMSTGKFSDGNANYICAESGAMHKSKWVKLGSSWYYATKSGALKTGWHKSGGKWYWLQPDADGLMAAGQWIDDKGKRYYLTSKGPGQMATGWFQIGSAWYYADKRSGAQQQSGWVKSGGKWYWLKADEQGKMAADEFMTVDGALYSFESSGAMRAKCQVRLEDDICGYAAKSGAISKIGTFDGNTVVLRNDAGEILSGWQKFGDTWFYANDQGIMQTGTITVGGKRYKMDTSGAWKGRSFANAAWSDRIVAAAHRTPFQGNGYCAKWANYVYVNAGFKHPDGHAYDLYRKYCTISDLDDIEPGMIIAVPSHTRSSAGKKYGHVAVYLGNGMVRHNKDRLETIPLSQWLAYYETTYRAKCGWAVA